jgi:hypothetical protein
MLTIDEMPEDNADLAKIKIDFPFLKDNSEKKCPIGMQEIQDYLRIEDADLDEVKHRKLTFLRTAQVAEKSYWIWKYNESDGAECYVTVSLTKDGSTVTGMNENYDELSPEQFLLGDYYNVF